MHSVAFNLDSFSFDWFVCKHGHCMWCPRQISGMLFICQMPFTFYSLFLLNLLRFLLPIFTSQEPQAEVAQMEGIIIFVLSLPNAFSFLVDFIFIFMFNFILVSTLILTFCTFYIKKAVNWIGLFGLSSSLFSCQMRSTFLFYFSLMFTFILDALEVIRVTLLLSQR